MMYWIGIIISFIGGIIGIGLSREIVKRKFPIIREKHLDLASIGILVLGLLISSIDHSEQSTTLRYIVDEQQGRILTLDQKEYLIETLSSLPKTSVYLMGIQGDRESVRFANTLKDILVEVGWEVDGVWEDNIIGGAGPGIVVRQGSSSPNLLGKNIIKALNHIQITSRLVINPDLKPNQLEIIVGSRP